MNNNSIANMSPSQKYNAALAAISSFLSGGFDAANKKGSRLSKELPYLKGVSFEFRPGISSVSVDVRFTEQLPNWKVQAGSYAQFMRKGSFELKSKFIKNLHMLSRIKVIDEGDYLIYDLNKDRLDFITSQVMGKILAFISYSTLQSELISKLPTLERYDHYNMWWSAEKSSKGFKLLKSYDVMEDTLASIGNLINPEHLATGFMPVAGRIQHNTDIPVIWKKDDNSFFAVNGIKKALARIKLARSSNGGEAGKFQVIILDDVPDIYSRHHEAGGAYVPNRVFEKFGPSRATSQELLKAVFTPMHVISGWEKSIEDQLGLQGQNWKIIG